MKQWHDSRKLTAYTLLCLQTAISKKKATTPAQAAPATTSQTSPLSRSAWSLSFTNAFAQWSARSCMFFISSLLTVELEQLNDILYYGIISISLSGFSGVKNVLILSFCVRIICFCEGSLTYQLTCTKPHLQQMYCKQLLLNGSIDYISGLRTLNYDNQKKTVAKSLENRTQSVNKQDFCPSSGIYRSIATYNQHFSFYIILNNSFLTLSRIAQCLKQFKQHNIVIKLHYIGTNYYIV
ncbi:Hypothetical_protein [Hexamita inflata]|uniref:Hypothetical_protein n=1 Tax=Hexamita inflata TaxID=28002 RepID=A0AA86S413_9EUKA|nr:Hypothetical protein HINF_LOCUS65290 [Hexamita inflata]